MKLLATVAVAALGQNSFDYDFYSSGEAYRFGSVGDFSHHQGDAASTQPLVYQEDHSVAPLDADGIATPNAPLNSQGAYLHAAQFMYADPVRYRVFGHSGNRRYCHTTRNNRAVYNWTSNKYGGYFAEGRNFMECMGEELYCFIEERAQYGQIIGISAGCEQMMNHPSVTIQDQQELISASYTQINAIKNNYNQEAARGGANRHGFFTYYGLGGCLAMPAQNGHHFATPKKRPAERGNSSGEYELNDPSRFRIGNDSANWRSYKWLNYYRNFHGGYGQNQCLRFPKQRLNPRNDPASAADIVDKDVTCADNSVGGSSGPASTTGCNKRVSSNVEYTSPGTLLSFGVSVCRACCVAEFKTDDTAFANTLATAAHRSMLCNYPPDTDAIIEAATDEQFEEIIPRFDMAGPSYNAFQKQNGIVKFDDQDNNMFVHGSWCSEPGPSRGCARIAQDTGTPTLNYVYGSDLSASLTVTDTEWVYTCAQEFRTANNEGGHQPIPADYNRDWCPGRPWPAISYNDARHTKPTAGAYHNIVGK